MSMGSQLTLSAWTTRRTRRPRRVRARVSRVRSARIAVERLERRQRRRPAEHRPPASRRWRSAATRSRCCAIAQRGQRAGPRGKFDITFGALSDIWQFDHDQDNVVPDRQLIETRLPRIDYRAVQTDRTAGTAFITRPGMRVHLGGIGKGYAIDRAVALLKQRGFTRLHDPVGRRSVRGRHQRRPAVEAGHRRSARRARTVRDAGDRATARSARQATTSDRS